MNTLRLKATRADKEQQEAISQSADIVRSGGLVAFPTETVYGLGANALDAAAVAKVFAAKGRPGWDPLIVHVCDEAMLARVIAPLPRGRAMRVKRLIEAFWPGPLTLLLPKHPDIPSAVTAGRSRVGVRMPQHPVALDLIRLAGVPIAAPSANLFGHTSPTTAEHVLRDLDGRIDSVLDGGATEIGVESTVLDVWPEDSPSRGMVVYRPGRVTLTQIRAIAGRVRMYAPPSSDSARRNSEAAVQEGLPSPGVGLRHYAPSARLILVASGQEMSHVLHDLHSTDRIVGVMLPKGWLKEAEPETANRIIFRWARMTDPPAQARLLFAGLRELDQRGADVIVCPLPTAEGIGQAMLDRLRKAAMS